MTDQSINPLRDERMLGDRVPPPTVMVIFGASGDLTRRKLVPALYTLARDRRLPPSFAVVGVARRDLEHNVFRESMRAACNQFARRRPVDDQLWATFSQGLFYSSGTFESPAT
jgi:glucose-6-phosphate 1-dehydrogenase